MSDKTVPTLKRAKNMVLQLAPTPWNTCFNLRNVVCFILASSKRFECLDTPARALLTDLPSCTILRPSLPFLAAPSLVSPPPCFFSSVVALLVSAASLAVTWSPAPKIAPSDSSSFWGSSLLEALLFCFEHRRFRRRIQFRFCPPSLLGFLSDSVLALVMAAPADMAFVD